MSEVFGGQVGAGGMTPKELDGAIEEISHERGLLHQGDDGIAEAPHEHGVAAHLRAIVHPSPAPADPPATPADDDAAWERERKRIEERDSTD